MCCHYTWEQQSLGQSIWNLIELDLELWHLNLTLTDKLVNFLTIGHIYLFMYKFDLYFGQKKQQKTIWQNWYFELFYNDLSLWKTFTVKVKLLKFAYIVTTLLFIYRFDSFLDKRTLMIKLTWWFIQMWPWHFNDLDQHCQIWSTQLCHTSLCQQNCGRFSP
jgi:hypothetical protein